MKVFFISAVSFLIMISVYAADRLPEYDSPQWKELPGLQEVEKAAENGNIYAVYLLSQAYTEWVERGKKAMDAADRKWELEDKMISADMRSEKAFENYRFFAEKGFYLAQRIIADDCIINGSGTPEEYIKFLNKAVLQGDPVSQHNLALAYARGIFGNSDFKKAEKYWQLAAIQGNAGSLKELGVLYSIGFGNQKPDGKKAAKYYHLAAKRGDSAAAFLLAEIYENGNDFVKPDKELAIKYYRLAAQKSPAVFALLRQNHIDLKNRAEYYRWRGDFKMENKILEILSKKGGKFADIGLAINFFNGNSYIKQDKEKGLKLMLELAEDPDVYVYAQGWVAVFLMQEKRTEEAVYWYCRSVGNGNLRAFEKDPDFLVKHKPEGENLRLLSGIHIVAKYFGDPKARQAAEMLVSKKIIEPLK